MPLRTSALGLPPSTIHSTALPFSSTTLIWIHECGLMSSTFVTLPCSVMGRFTSNSVENA